MTKLLLFCIFIIIVYLCIKYITNKKQQKSKEPTDNQFLTAADTMVMLSNNQDGYLSAMSSIDKRVRQNNKLVAREWPKNLIDKIRQNNLPEFPIHFALIETGYEGDFPHTRGNVIVLTESVINNSRFPIILKHEIVHVLQKRNKTKWHDFYRKWGFELITNADIIPTELRQRIRNNPDIPADERLWLWRSRWVPICIYTEDAKSLADVNYVVYDIETGLLHNWRDVPAAAYFGRTADQPEGPNELAATMLAAGRSQKMSIGEVMLWSEYHVDNLDMLNIP